MFYVHAENGFVISENNDNQFKKAVSYKAEPGITYTNVEKNEGESIYIWKGLKSVSPWCKPIDFNSFNFSGTK